MTPALADEPRAQEQVAAAVAALREVAGEAILGAWLYGSAVVGGLRPASDLDILAVSARSLTGAERAAIFRRLLATSGAVGGPARPLELTILARPALTPWRHPGVIELQFGEWMRAEIGRGDALDWPRDDPDVAVLVETALRRSAPLFGPPLAALLDPPPRADLRRAMADLVPVILPGIEQGDDRRNGLLTLARIWSTLATGEIRPKDAAADWALARLPEALRPVLAHARAVYLGAAREDWTGLAPLLRPHVAHVVARIDALTQDGPAT